MGASVERGDLLALGVANGGRCAESRGWTSQVFQVPGLRCQVSGARLEICAGCPGRKGGTWPRFCAEMDLRLGDACIHYFAAAVKRFSMPLGRAGSREH